MPTLTDLPNEIQLQILTEVLQTHPRNFQHLDDRITSIDLSTRDIGTRLLNVSRNTRECALSAIHKRLEWLRRHCALMMVEIDRKMDDIEKHAISYAEDYPKMPGADKVRKRQEHDKRVSEMIDSRHCVRCWHAEHRVLNELYEEYVLSPADLEYSERMPLYGRWMRLIKESGEHGVRSLGQDEAPCN
ncbi:MAG: hypothetical protein M1831_004029 [Alyxoria varia]|nr:MAG: hypothetical protein M1831_004029 [Alyxoria varia]